MIYTQLLFTLFVLFALSRVILRFRESKISLISLFGWAILWSLVEIIIWIPDSTTHIARMLGIGRGADLLIYVSIVSLFYLIFKILIKLEDVERQITHLTRKIALQNISSPKKIKKRKK